LQLTSCSCSVAVLWGSRNNFWLPQPTSTAEMRPFGGGGVVSKCALRAALVQKSVETAHGDNPALSAVWVPFLLNMYTVLPLQQNGAAN